MKTKNATSPEIRFKETELQHYIDVLGLKRVRDIATSIFEERESFTGSLFVDILEICQYETDEIKVKRFLKEIE